MPNGSAWSEYVMPNARGNRLDGMAARVGWDWAAERATYPREVCEMALAHAVGDNVEAAYRRGDLSEKRLTFIFRPIPQNFGALP